MAYTTINKSTNYFNTKLFVGSGSDNNAITGVGFQPDWIWFKNRSAANDHALVDAVRGANKAISSNNNTADITLNAGQDFDSFNSDGFTVDTPSQLNSFNKSGDDIVTWNWKANGQGSSNTDGTINTTYTSANTTAGFSIVKYTGNGTNNATFGHGLGVAPKIMIGKCIGNTNNWQVTGNAGPLTENKYFSLDQTSPIGTSTNVSFDASATTIKLQGGQGTNVSGQPHIAYCFAEKKGYSKFGSYVGNGNADGSFIFTGFKPAFVLQKRTANTSDWTLADNKRPGYNEINKRMVPNENAVEATNNSVDFLSNGFKCRSSQSNANTSGDTYFYMAFGQSLVGTNNVPCTAG
tara:strand:- start:747 stop:1796 length:1050 start_codon:yes stop_codon:yes gene_type:complete